MWKWVAAVVALAAGAAALAGRGGETVILSLATGEGTRPFEWRCPVLADEATTQDHAEAAHRALLDAFEASAQAQADAMMAAMDRQGDVAGLEGAFAEAEASGTAARRAAAADVERRFGCRLLGR